MRHIVTETKGLADWALQQVYAAPPTSSGSSRNCRNGTSDSDTQRQGQPQANRDDGHDDDDPFGRLARTLSVCQHTRTQGGKIGWVEPVTQAAADADGLPADHEYVQNLLPADVIRQVYHRRPKPGDTMVLSSQTSGQWHVIQVAEAWMHPPLRRQQQSPQQAPGTNNDNVNVVVDDDDDNDDNQPDRQYQTDLVGAHQGINRVVRRPKLKGAGVLPTLPNRLKTFWIQTAGCQMNVADSERLQGVLQNELNLVPAPTPREADVVLLNTCRYVERGDEAPWRLPPTNIPSKNLWYLP